MPKFSHALLDLTGFDPAADEQDAQVRAVLQLMQLARKKELMRFFRWLVDLPAQDFPNNVLELMRLYAMHAQVRAEYDRRFKRG